MQRNTYFNKEHDDFETQRLMQKKLEKMRASIDRTQQEQRQQQMSPEVNQEDGAKENTQLISAFSGKGQQVSGHDLILYQIDNQKIKLTDTLKLYILGIQY